MSPSLPRLVRRWDFGSDEEWEAWQRWEYNEEREPWSFLNEVLPQIWPTGIDLKEILEADKNPKPID